MRKLLTVQAIQRLKPKPERREIADDKVDGLRLIIQPSGQKSWAYRYRFGGKYNKLTLGPVLLTDGETEPEPKLGDPLTLRDARKLARLAATDKENRRDPAARKMQAPPADADGDLFRDIVERFTRRYLSGKRSGAETRRLLDRHVVPVWGARPIASITKKDVIALLDGLRDRGMAQGANRVLAAGRRLFNWAAEVDVIATPPTAGVKAPVPEVSRDRVLTDDEIKLFWQATDKIGWPFGPLFKLLLLTGQRLSEVAEMTHGELNLAEGIWTIPKERAKNGLAHTVPLSAEAIAVIESLPKIRSKAGYQFTTNGETPVSGFSRAKSILDKAMADLSAEEIPGWWLHDLRRTCATGLQRLGTRFEVIEALLNHQSGRSKSGMGPIYQKYEWGTEKVQALQAWGRRVLSLVEDQSTDNVVELRKAGSV